MKFYSYFVIAFLAFFTPFAFGGAEPWGLFIFNFVCIAYSCFILLKRNHFCVTSISKIVLALLTFIIFLSLIQLLNQHTFLQKSTFLPFTLCRYYSLEGLNFALFCFNTNNRKNKRN